VTSFKLDERRVRRRQVLRTAVDDCISELETQGACFSGWRRAARLRRWGLPDLTLSRHILQPFSGINCGLNRKGDRQKFTKLTGEGGPHFQWTSSRT
jgi:hypothetical protein